MRASKGKLVAWITAALAVLVLVPATASAGLEVGGPCNGSTELCDRTLDQVVLPGTHNSMNAAEETGWALPNQSYSISNQLNLGVRSLLFDTYYAKTDLDGVLQIVPKAQGRIDHTQTFMCHAFCFLGSVDLTAELGRIVDFLGANPREVLTFINQDAISPEDFATAVENSGLLPYVYQGPETTFPTLEQMIDSGQRVVMLAEQEAAGVAWYHRAYSGSVMETPYSFPADPGDYPTGPLTDPAQLNESCKPNRGQEPSPLFLMNHWITTGVIPEPEKAAVANTRQALVARARACESRRGKLPNIVAVDFFGQGDLIGAVRELNGLPDPVDPVPVDPKAILTVSKTKSVTVRSKRKAKYRVKLYNSGDARAGKVKVCAKVPPKLARKPRCATIATVPVDGSAVAKLSVRTKKLYRKGSGKVRFSIHSSEQAMIRSSAKLTVKPLKKSKRSRKN